MGYYKEQLAKAEYQETVATGIAVDAGVIRVCEFHGMTFEGLEEPVSAYKLGNYRFSRGELSEVFGSRGEMTDAIEHVIGEQPEECPRCVKFRYE